MFNQIFLPKIEKIKKHINFNIFKKREACLDLSSFQKIFNEQINIFLDEKIKDYKTYSNNVLVNETIDYAVSLIRGGGKRIRPYLIYTAFYNEGGLNKEKMMQAGIAIELFHTFALIHDDIIDRGVERHGKETVHVYLEKFISQSPRGDKAHIAEGLAILAGDLIFSWANELILKIENRNISKVFFRMIEEIVAGQLLDVSFMLEYKVKSEEIIRKNELKTALYSFVNPMCIGSLLVGGKNTAFYTELGLCIGKAYQIQDDLLDILGDSSVTGKGTFIDIEDGQHTILTQYILEHADEKSKNVFLSLFGKKIDEHGKKVLLNLFQDTKAVWYAEKEIQTLFNDAKKIIEESDMEENVKSVWLNLMQIIIKRKS
jgi:geranylgeranyl diphosphate synthase type I